jgi:hypothetical protein
MYDPYAALRAIDQHRASILVCLLVTVVFAFAYFLVAIRVAIRQQVYVVPFTGAALFFWHDLSFVLEYDKWFHVYDHWWVKMWWFALLGTVALEAFLIYQVIRYGHRELWPSLSRRAYTVLMLGGTVAIGALWMLIKRAMHDDLYFISFAITAMFSVPFHTALMTKRQSRAGQSIFMQASTIVMILAMTATFAQIDSFFRSGYFLGFVASFICWALVNIWLIRKLPAQAQVAVPEAAVLTPA